MTKSILSQRECQRQVILDAGYDPDKFIGVENIWWRNPTNRNSFRLTFTGYKWFTSVAQLKPHTVELTDIALFPRQLLQLERHLTQPYFIKFKSISLFSEQDAVMLLLHGGDLVKYLQNLEDYNK